MLKTVRRRKIKESPIELVEVSSLVAELNGTPIELDYKRDGFARRREVTSSERAQDIVDKFGRYAHYSGTHTVYQVDGQQQHFIYLEAGLIIGGKLYNPLIEKATLEYTI